MIFDFLSKQRTAIATYLVQTIALGLIVYDLGVEHSVWLSAGYAAIMVPLLLLNLSLHFTKNKVPRLAWASSIAIAALILATILMLLSGRVWSDTVEVLHNYYLASIALYFIHRASLSTQLLLARQIHPANLFVGSFAGIIVMGALLLLLPAATPGSISITDAFFTATSAVCVTGLIVVDTATDFTFFGQTVILFLIQLGGLGILTFTSFFAYFFKGNSSLQETVMLRDMVSSEQLGNVFKVVVKIVVATLVIELIGALGIYFSTDPAHFSSWYEQVFFALFHSVSAFCNAGFSILTDGLYDGRFRFNYGLQWMVILLIIFGGLGFNILNNLYEYLKITIKNSIHTWERNLDAIVVRPRIISLNSRIVIQTTLILLTVGVVFFLFSEFRQSLSSHDSWWGKFTTAMFCSTTPRTAGFNTIDMRSLSVPGVMATMLLMWIGASPASTGGGIKTSTFALAVLNVWAVVRGRPYIELGHREVPTESVQRAFAIIALSLAALSIGIFALSWMEPDKDLVDLSFECVSAYSTSGLSLGITSHLGTGSKWVLIALMFSGRVGTLNLLAGMLQQLHRANYRYPQESVLIN